MSELEDLKTEFGDLQLLYRSEKVLYIFVENRKSYCYSG